MSKADESKRSAAHLMKELGAPLNFILQLFLNQTKGVVVGDHVFIVRGKIKGLLRHTPSTNVLTFDPHWPSIDVSQTAESLFSQKAIDVDMHLNQTVARHFSTRWDPAMMFLPSTNPAYASQNAQFAAGSGGGHAGAGNNNHNNSSSMNSASPASGKLSQGGKGGGHSSSAAEQPVQARYFAKEGLFDVISDLRQTRATGILMEYRTPIDGFHNLLRATFTPFLLRREMRRSSVSLKDHQVPLKYRVSTSSSSSSSSSSGVNSPSSSSSSSSSPQQHRSLHQQQQLGAKEVTVPDSAAELVRKMLKSLVDKREEGGEFVERLVAYFIVISPKQVLFLWCSQINVMPLEHAIQLQETVTSLEDPNEEQQQQQQTQQLVNNNNTGSGNNNNTSSSLLLSASSSSSSSSSRRHHSKRHSSSGIHNNSQLTPSQLRKLRLSPHQADYHLTPSMMKEMKTNSNASEQERQHQHVKSESFILSCLPESLTSLRETDQQHHKSKSNNNGDTSSCLQRVRESYHSSLLGGEGGKNNNNKKKNHQHQKEEQHQEEGEKAKGRHQEEGEGEEEEEQKEEALLEQSVVEEEQEEEEEQQQQQQIRSLATAAAARHVARMFGVTKEQLPPKPQGLGLYKKHVRDESDYSACRTEIARKQGIADRAKNKKRQKEDGSNKLTLALERAKMRREAEQQRNLHLVQHPQGEHKKGVSSALVVAAAAAEEKEQEQEGGEEEEEEQNQEGEEGEKDRTLFAELPSAARNVELLQDDDYDDFLNDMQEPTHYRFDTGLSGYLIDMPAQFIFTKYGTRAADGKMVTQVFSNNNNAKNNSASNSDGLGGLGGSVGAAGGGEGSGKGEGAAEGGNRGGGGGGGQKEGLLDEMLKPSVLRAQKRRERIARTNTLIPDLIKERVVDSQQSYLEQTVSSRTGAGLVSSQLLTIGRRTSASGGGGGASSSSSSSSSSPTGTTLAVAKGLNKRRRKGGLTVSEMLFDHTEPIFTEELAREDNNNMNASSGSVNTTSNMNTSSTQHHHHQNKHHKSHQDQQQQQQQQQHLQPHHHHHDTPSSSAYRDRLLSSSSALSSRLGERRRSKSTIFSRKSTSTQQQQQQQQNSSSSAKRTSRISGGGGGGSTTTGGNDHHHHHRRSSAEIDVASYFQNFPVEKHHHHHHHRRGDHHHHQEEEEGNSHLLHLVDDSLQQSPIYRQQQQQQGSSSRGGSTNTTHDYSSSSSSDGDDSSDDDYEGDGDSTSSSRSSSSPAAGGKKSKKKSSKRKGQQDYYHHQGGEEDEQEAPTPLAWRESEEDSIARYSYTVQRIRALGQLIFQTAADLLYRSVSHQASRRSLVEVVIPFGFRHLDQELRSVFLTLGLEEQSIDSMHRIADFREQHDNDGTSFGDLAFNNTVSSGEASSMFEDENFVRQSNGTIASVRDEWYSLEGGGSVVFVLHNALVAVPRAEKLLTTLETELNPLARFDSPLCSPKDIETCKRLCELVADRGFTICDACHVLTSERKQNNNLLAASK